MNQHRRRFISAGNGKIQVYRRPMSYMRRETSRRNHHHVRRVAAACPRRGHRAASQRKIAQQVVYRLADVIAWIESGKAATEHLARPRAKKGA